MSNPIDKGVTIVPVLNWTGPRSIAAGVTITVNGPSPADPTLANVNFTITG
jgi:hypothetical protein